MFPLILYTLFIGTLNVLGLFLFYVADTKTVKVTKKNSPLQFFISSAIGGLLVVWVGVSLDWSTWSLVLAATYMLGLVYSTINRFRVPYNASIYFAVFALLWNLVVIIGLWTDAL